MRGHLNRERGIGLQARYAREWDEWVAFDERRVRLDCTAGAKSFLDGSGSYASCESRQQLVQSRHVASAIFVSGFNRVRRCAEMSWQGVQVIKRMF